MFLFFSRVSLAAALFFSVSDVPGMDAEVEVLCAQGEEEILSGDAETALVTFTRAIELDPDCAEAYFGRGWAYYRKNSDELTLQNFEKALELDPDFGKSYVGMAWLAIDSGNDYEAMEFIEKALELMPDWERVYTTRGSIYANLGRP